MCIKLCLTFVVNYLIKSIRNALQTLIILIDLKYNVIIYTDPNDFTY